MDEEKEIELLKRKCKAMGDILKRSFPEKSGSFFISGAGRIEDDFLPDHVSICPSYGADWSEMYVRRGIVAWKPLLNMGIPAKLKKDGTVYIFRTKDDAEDVSVSHWDQRKNCWYDVCSYSRWYSDEEPYQIFDWYARVG